MAGVAEAFSAFFPVSFLLFLVLAIGKTHIFPWIGQDLHGKEVWLNTGFLLTRDALGLLVLYVLGGAWLVSLARRIFWQLWYLPRNGFKF